MTRNKTSLSQKKLLKKMPKAKAEVQGTKKAKLETKSKKASKSKSAEKLKNLENSKLAEELKMLDKNLPDPDDFINPTYCIAGMALFIASNPSSAMY